MEQEITVATKGEISYLSQFCKSACPRNFVTPLGFCFDRNSEMEGRRELSDVLN